MKKSDLKTGMLIETADNRLRLVWGNTLIGIDNAGGVSLNDIKEDLRSTVNYPSSTIIKIYKEPIDLNGAGLVFWFSHPHSLLNRTELLWEQVCKELGREIKIIKG